MNSIISLSIIISNSEKNDLKWCYTSTYHSVTYGLNKITQMIINSKISHLLTWLISQEILRKYFRQFVSNKEIYIDTKLRNIINI